MESESNVNRFMEEMSDMGLAIDWAVSSTQPSSINITQNACHFSRVAYSLARDLAVLRLEFEVMWSIAEFCCSY